MDDGSTLDNVQVNEFLIVFVEVKEARERVQRNWGHEDRVLV